MIKYRKNLFPKCIAIAGILVSPIFQSCSTIRATDRIGKDYTLQESDYMKLMGTYIDSTRVDYPQESNTVAEYIYAACTVKIQPLNPKKLECFYYINDSLISSRIVKGKIKDGYFMGKTRLTVDFPFGPLLWGPGTKKNAYGITSSNDLIILEAHGGIAIFLILPFFAAGGESRNEHKRIE